MTASPPQQRRSAQGEGRTPSLRRSCPERGSAATLCGRVPRAMAFAAAVAASAWAWAHPLCPWTYAGPSAPPPHSDDSLVTGFTLIDARTERAVRVIEDGATLSLAGLGNRGMNLRADLPESADVSGVLLDLRGPVAASYTASSAPFALFGASGTSYRGGVLPDGDYTLTAQPLDASSAGLPARAVDFTVSGSAMASAFTLLDAPGGYTDVGPILNGARVHAVWRRYKHNIRGDPLTTQGSRAFHMCIWRNGRLSVGSHWPREPHTQFGDKGSPAGLRPGNYHMRMTGHTRHTNLGGEGEHLTRQWVSFVIVPPDRAVDPVTGFTLVDASGGAPDPDLGTIVDRATLDVSGSATGEVSIRAEIAPQRPDVTRVEFALRGPVDADRTEDVRPYSLFGDSEGDYAGATLANGAYTLTAQPYDDDGRALTAKTVRFGVGPLAATVAAVSETVSEGDPAVFEVTLTAAPPTTVAVPVTVAADGATLSGTVPSSVTFDPGQMTAELTVATADDAVVSADGTVTATLAAGDGYLLGTPDAATVTVADDDEAVFSVTAWPTALREGGSSTLTVSITNSVTYAAAQAIALEVTGDVSASDYSLPATLTLAGGASSATAAFLAQADDDEEDDLETATVTARLGEAVIGTATLTLEDPEPIELQPRAQPEVRGVPQVGGTLTAVVPGNGGASAVRATVRWASASASRGATAEPAFEWLRDGERIPGATGASYVLAAADAGAAISVRDVRGGLTRATSPATVPVWGPPGNPALAAHEEALHATTMTLAYSEALRAPLAGYARYAGASFGSLDADAFEFDGVSYRLTAFALNVGGGLGLATAPALPAGTPLVAYWDGHRLAGFEATADATGGTVWQAYTPQPASEYVRYRDGASDGVRVAVSVRRLPLRRLSAADAQAAEGDGRMAFSVTLDGAAAAAVSVDYATEDGTALAGEDYAAASGTLTFAVGETSKTVAVTLLDDAAVEADETLALTLSNAVGAGIADAAATGTIVDDDHEPETPALSVSDARGTEGGTVSFEVTLHPPAGEQRQGVLQHRRRHRARRRGLRRGVRDARVRAGGDVEDGVGGAGRRRRGGGRRDVHPGARLVGDGDPVRGPQRHGDDRGRLRAPGGPAGRAGGARRRGPGVRGGARVRRGDRGDFLRLGARHAGDGGERHGVERAAELAAAEPGMDADRGAELGGGRGGDPDAGPHGAGRAAAARWAAGDGARPGAQGRERGRRDGDAAVAEPRDGFGTPAGTDWAVAVNGAPRAVASAEIAGRRAVLVLSAPAAPADR